MRKKSERQERARPPIPRQSQPPKLQRADSSEFIEAHWAYVWVRWGPLGPIGGLGLGGLLWGRLLSTPWSKASIL